MGRPKIDIHQRAHEYKSEGFYVSDTNILMCKYCNTRIEWQKKDTLDKHVSSANHLKVKNQVPGPSGVKRQSTIQGSFDRLKRAKEEKNTFVEDTVRMCLKANIPINKLDHPAVRDYLHRYVSGSGDLPSANSLRRKYVSLCGQKEKDATRTALKDKPVVIVADETSDTLGRCVFAVLFRTIDSLPEQCCYLASVNFLDTANASTCSQAIIDTLKEYDIQYNNVWGLVSDSARYMEACFKLLKTLIGEQIFHYKCWAHKVNLVGDVFLSEFRELNSLVSKLKTAFLHSRKMKSAYILFLKEKAPEIPAKLFPAPVVTRWNSWFKAVIYLNDYLEHLLIFIKNSDNQNSSTLYINQAVENQALASKIRVQIVFLAEACPKIMQLIDYLEGSNYPFAHLLWEKLEDLKSTLVRHSDGYFGTKTSDMLLEANDENDALKIMLQTAAKKSLEKLTKHMATNETNDLYQEINKLFNPSRVGASKLINASAISSSLKKIIFFRNISESSLLDGYSHFHRQLLSTLSAGDVPDVLQILLAAKPDHPDFSKAAIQCIWSPVNSVDAERFFSLYNITVTDRRTRMSEETVVTTTMLAFN